IEIYRNITTGRYITVTGAELVPGNCRKLTNIDPLIDHIIAQHQDAERSSSGGDDRHAGPDDRSATFHSTVCQLAALGCSVEEIEQHRRRDHNGVATKYLAPKDRLLAEIERSYHKWKRQHQPAAARCSQRASEYEMRAVEWLWQSRIVKGALNVLAGLPD